MYIFQTVSKPLSLPPSANHLPDSVSTSLKFFVAQFFSTQTPFGISTRYMYIPIEILFLAVTVILLYTVYYHNR